MSTTDLAGAVVALGRLGRQGLWDAPSDVAAAAINEQKGRLCAANRGGHRT